MASGPEHEEMTIEAMERLQFSLDAQNTAARANVAVDELQGNTADQSNLHAMRGYMERDRFLRYLQTEDESRQACEELLERAKGAIVAKVLAREFLEALRGLGAALHTVQDIDFHVLEPWPYEGIGEALAADLNYMICHGIRDAGAISRLNLDQVHRGGFNVEVSRPIGRQWYLSFGYSHNPAVSDSFPHPLGRNGGEPDGPLGWSATMSLTYGAAPGSLPAPAPAQADSDALYRSPHWGFATHGVGARERAEHNSREFVLQVQELVLGRPHGRQLWDEFRRFRWADWHARPAQTSPAPQAAGARR